MKTKLVTLKVLTELQVGLSLCEGIGRHEHFEHGQAYCKVIIIIIINHEQGESSEKDWIKYTIDVLFDWQKRALSIDGRENISNSDNSIKIKVPGGVKEWWDENASLFCEEAWVDKETGIT